MSFTNYQLRLEKIASIVYICPPQNQVEVMHQWAKELLDIHRADFERMNLKIITEDVIQACTEYRRDKYEAMR